MSKLIYTMVLIFCLSLTLIGSVFAKKLDEVSKISNYYHFHESVDCYAM